MKVRIKKKCVINEKSFNVGSIVEPHHRLGYQLIADGKAELVEEQPTMIRRAVPKKTTFKKVEPVEEPEPTEEEL